jgi:hypothetical protein
MHNRLKENGQLQRQVDPEGYSAQPNCHTTIHYTQLSTQNTAQKHSTELRQHPREVNAHLMQNRLKKNGQLQLQVEPEGHSAQPKGSHMDGTAGLGVLLTGYEAVEAIPHSPSLLVPYFRRK